MKTIREQTMAYWQYAGGIQIFNQMSDKDKGFWKDYLVNIKVVEDENDRHRVEINYLPNNAASNLLTSSVSS